MKQKEQDMAILSKPSTSARTAVIYVTAGVLTAVWSGIWYAYMVHSAPESEVWWYICYGFILSGFALTFIGLAIGRIGRSARHAELPPEEVIHSVIQASQEKATHPAVIAPLGQEAAVVTGPRVTETGTPIVSPVIQPVDQLKHLARG
jgi:hypothetical protein